MAIISTTPNQRAGNFLKKLALVAALGACGLAQADVLTFEQPTDSSFLFAGDHVQMGKYWIESYGGNQGDLVGAIIDGSDSDTCISVSCPVNNASHYYAGLDDGYFFFGMNDASNFKVKSLQASFIGAGQASFPATSGLLILQGFNFEGAAVGGALQLGLGGPNAQGQFNFANFNLGAFSNTFVSYVRVLGYACDGSGNCNRSSNLSNFAIDNIETIPEPTTWALLGLGLIGLGAFSRRRAA
ncbi:MAG: NF038120 family PEP-CTERM protein [Pseudomonadota bacterium]